MPRIDPGRILFVVLALLLGVAGVALHRVPVQRYVVGCTRTTQVMCTLEQARASATQRQQLALGADPTASVRLRPQRRGPARVFLYLESATGSIFAAEFEGADATAAAESAAAQLNRVLHATAPGAARVEAAPPAIFRWSAWGALLAAGLLVLLAFRQQPSMVREPAPGPTALAQLYEREGRYFIEASDRTRWSEAGYWVSNGRVAVFDPTADDEAIGGAVLEALAASRVEVPIPPRGTKLEAGLFRAMGVRSRRAAMSGTRCCMITREPPGGAIRVEPQRNGGTTGDGRGYSAIAERAVTLPFNSSAAEVGSAIRIALADAIHA